MGLDGKAMKNTSDLKDQDNWTCMCLTDNILSIVGECLDISEIAVVELHYAPNEPKWWNMGNATHVMWGF